MSLRTQLLLFACIANAWACATDIPGSALDGGNAGDSGTDEGPAIHPLVASASAPGCLFSPEGEGIDRLADGTTDSKYLAFPPESWFALRLDEPAVLTEYSISSGNDAPERDPIRWTVQGSNDGYAWSLLDSRAGQSFAERLQTRDYPVESNRRFGTPVAYRMYRFFVESSTGDYVQISEIELRGYEGFEDALLAEAPTSSNAVASGRNQFNLVWQAGSASRWRIEHATDAANFSVLSYVRGDQRSYKTPPLADGPHQFRIVAESANGTSAGELVQASVAPITHTSDGGQQIFERDGYQLRVVQRAGVAQQYIDAIAETYFRSYPEMRAAYQPEASKSARLLFDSTSPNGAYFDGTNIRIGTAFPSGSPDDLDVFTHVVFHQLQVEYQADAPSWLREGIADYARFEHGRANLGGCWRMPRFQDGQHYTDSFSISARFLWQLEASVSPGIVRALDQSLRAGSYAPNFWKGRLGKSLDAVWSEYVEQYGEHRPVIYP